jgi:hypothetical protein
MLCHLQIRNSSLSEIPAPGVLGLKRLTKKRILYPQIHDYFLKDTRVSCSLLRNSVFVFVTWLIRWKKQNNYWLVEDHEECVLQCACCIGVPTAASFVQELTLELLPFCTTQFILRGYFTQERTLCRPYMYLQYSRMCNVQIYSCLVTWLRYGESDIYLQHTQLPHSYMGEGQGSYTILTVYGFCPFVHSIACVCVCVRERELHILQLCVGGLMIWYIRVWSSAFHTWWSYI